MEDVLTQGVEQSLIIDAAIAEASSRRRPSGASARISAKRNAMPAARSSTTSRCRSRRCRLSSRKPTPRLPRSSPERARCRSAISGTAISTTTSPSRPAPTRPSYLKRWDEMNAAVFAVVKKYGGSISAEHGVGVMKRDLLPSVKDPVALDLMRSLKAPARSQAYFEPRQGPLGRLRAYAWSMIVSKNQFPPPDQVRGQAFLESRSKSVVRRRRRELGR